MIHAIAFSGGKDSTALLCWAKKHLSSFVAVFCDTGWEHPVTYTYIEYINQKLLDGQLIRLQSEGMTALVARKGRVPSAKARFCTEALKVNPMKKWVAEQNDEVTIYQGIRADESRSRAGMSESEWSDVYDAQVERPLFRWTAEQCFELSKSYGIEPNPLYLAGARRVGCFPCVMITHGELERLRRFYPVIWERAEMLEKITGKSFFPPNYIPKRFQTGYDPKSGKSYPILADVRKYIETGEKTKGFWDEKTPSCLSIYGGLCE